MFVPEETKRFIGPKSADDLGAYLEETTKATNIVRIADPVMIRLDDSGRLAGKYRLTFSAAREYGSRVANHFGASLIELAGAAKTADDISEISRGANTLAGVSYDRFEGWRWVIDMRNNAVVGLVGPRYRVTTNTSFWAGIRRTCLTLADKPQLFTALVVNRNMDVVMAGEDRVSVGSTTFARGMLAQNAETSGRAVRASNALISVADGAWACDNFYADTRIPHLRGRKFDMKMAQIYEKLVGRRISDSNLQKSWAAAFTTKLFKPKVSQEVNNKRLVEFMKGKGVSSTDAAAVVSSVSAVRQWPTAIDLFRILSRRAAGRNDINAIRCRQVAYELCFMRIS